MRPNLLQKDSLDTFDCIYFLDDQHAGSSAVFANELEVRACKTTKVILRLTGGAAELSDTPSSGSEHMVVKDKSSISRTRKVLVIDSSDEKQSNAEESSDSEIMPFKIHPSVRSSAMKGAGKDDICVISSDSSDGFSSCKHRLHSKGAKKEAGMLVNTPTPGPTIESRSEKTKKLLEKRRASSASKQKTVYYSDSASSCVAVRTSDMDDKSDNVIQKLRNRNNNSDEASSSSDVKVSSRKRSNARNARKGKEVLTESSEDERPRKRKQTKRKHIANKSYLSDESDLELDSSADEVCDVSFYRNLDLQMDAPPDFEDTAIDSLEEIETYKTIYERQKYDPEFVSLAKYFNKVVSSDKFRHVRGFLDKLPGRKESYDLLDHEEESTAAQLDIRVEKAFLDGLLHMANTSFLGSPKETINEYDSFRIQEFLSEIPALISDGRPPRFIRDFVEQVENTLARLSEAGRARMGTAVDVNIDIQKNLIHHVLYQNIMIRSLPSDVKDHSRLLFCDYAERRDEAADKRPKVYNGKSKSKVTEADRAKAIEEMEDMGDDISLIMCQGIVFLPSVPVVPETSDLPGRVIGSVFDRRRD
jgi:hypothetical protein